ncbi:MAG: hypothetical protein KAH56_09370 [Candidatus Krumholzibacteria bacterium]|nr:hypothetical protein [Candidatus Krumholzibacteria bacterium]
MIIRNGIAALAFWALLLAPFLCGLGVLAHSCICEDSTECRHELDCFADPCRILALRATDQDSQPDYSPDQVEHFNPPALVDDFVARVETRPDLISDPTGDLPNMIVFDSVLPLLC